MFYHILSIKNVYLLDLTNLNNYLENQQIKSVFWAIAPLTTSNILTFTNEKVNIINLLLSQSIACSNAENKIVFHLH